MLDTAAEVKARLKADDQSFKPFAGARVARCPRASDNLGCLTCSLLPRPCETL